MMNTNMRRLLKTPTLRMMDGGDLQIPKGPGMDRAGMLARNPGVAQNQAASPSPGQLSAQPAAAPTSLSTPAGVSPLSRPAPGLPGGENTGGAGAQMYGRASANLASMEKTSLEMAGVKPGVPPSAPAAPTLRAAPTFDRQAAILTANQDTNLGLAAAGLSIDPREPNKMAIGMKDGGEGPKHEFPDGLPAHARGLGGEVKGDPQAGDVKPSFYTGGEFVASRAMLKKEPGLRDYLNDLRTEVLAEKGMTPEQADAKAVSGPTLRAQSGGPGLWPYNQRDVNIYGGLGKPASAPENQPGPGGILGSRQTQGAQNGQTQTTVAGAGPTSAGGATGGWSNSAPRPDVSGVQGGPAGVAASDQFLPTTRAGLRDSGVAISDAINQGKFAKAGGKAVTGTVSLAKNFADDVIGGFGRGAYSLARNPAEDFGRGVLGMEDRKEAPPTSSADATPAAPTQPAGSNSKAYQLRQGTLGENDNAYHGDLTGKINAAMKSGQTDLASTGMRANDIYKTKSANGTTSYSGYGDGSGRLGNLVSGDGTALRSGGSVSTVPGMSKELIAQTLRNPDGSQWSAADNALMAANLRDGVSPYAGTSRADKTPQMSPLRARLEAMGGRGMSKNQAATLVSLRQNDQRNEVDMAQAAASQRNAEVTAESNRVSALRLQGESDRKDRREERTLINDERKFQTDEANTQFDQVIKGNEAHYKKVLNSLPPTKGKNGPEANTQAAAAYMTGAHAAVAARAAELRKAGNVAGAAALERQGTAGITASDHQDLLNGMEIMKRFSDIRGQWFTDGTEGKMSNNPMDFVVKGPHPTDPKKVILRGGQSMDMDDVTGTDTANRFGLPFWGGGQQTNQYLPK